MIHTPKHVQHSIDNIELQQTRLLEFQLKRIKDATTDKFKVMQKNADLNPGDNLKKELISELNSIIQGNKQKEQNLLQLKNQIKVELMEKGFNQSVTDSSFMIDQSQLFKVINTGKVDKIMQSNLPVPQGVIEYKVTQTELDQRINFLKEQRKIIAQQIENQAYINSELRHKLIQQNESYKSIKIDVQNSKNLTKIAENRFMNVYHIERHANDQKQTIKKDLQQIQKQINRITKTEIEYLEKRRNKQETNQLIIKKEERKMNETSLQLELLRNENEIQINKIQNIDLDFKLKQEREVMSQYVGQYIWVMEILESLFLMQDFDIIPTDQFLTLKTQTPPILTREEIIKIMENFMLVQGGNCEKLSTLILNQFKDLNDEKNINEKFHKYLNQQRSIQYVFLGDLKREAEDLLQKNSFLGQNLDSERGQLRINSLNLSTNVIKCERENNERSILKLQDSCVGSMKVMIRILNFVTELLVRMSGITIIMGLKSYYFPQELRDTSNEVFKKFTGCIYQEEILSEHPGVKKKTVIGITPKIVKKGSLHDIQTDLLEQIKNYPSEIQPYIDLYRKLIFDNKFFKQFVDKGVQRKKYQKKINHITSQYNKNNENYLDDSVLDELNQEASTNFITKLQNCFETYLEFFKKITFYKKDTVYKLREEDPQFKLYKNHIPSPSKSDFIKRVNTAQIGRTKAYFQSEDPDYYQKYAQIREKQDELILFKQDDEAIIKTKAIVEFINNMTDAKKKSTKKKKLSIVTEDQENQSKIFNTNPNPNPNPDPNLHSDFTEKQRIKQKIKYFYKFSQEPLFLKMEDEKKKQVLKNSQVKFYERLNNCGITPRIKTYKDEFRQIVQKSDVLFKIDKLDQRQPDLQKNHIIKKNIDDDYQSKQTLFKKDFKTQSYTYLKLNKSQLVRQEEARKQLNNMSLRQFEQEYHLTPQTGKSCSNYYISSHNIQKRVPALSTLSTLESRPFTQQIEKRQSIPTFRTTNLLFDSFNGRKSINNNFFCTALPQQENDTII